MKAKKIIAWLLVIIWMIVIFMFSNQASTSSDNVSKGVIGKTIETGISITNEVTGNDNSLTENEMYYVKRELNQPVRKLAHMTVYLVLGLLTINALRVSEVKNGLFWMIIICAFYASTDEIHQMFVPGRSGEVLDVMIDTGGSLIGYFIYYLLKRRKK